MSGLLLGWMSLSADSEVKAALGGLFAVVAIFKGAGPLIVAGDFYKGNKLKNFWITAGGGALTATGAFVLTSMYSEAGETTCPAEIGSTELQTEQVLSEMPTCPPPPAGYALKFT